MSDTIESEVPLVSTKDKAKNDIKLLGFFTALAAIVSLIIGISAMTTSVQKYNSVVIEPEGAQWSIPYTFDYPLTRNLTENFVNKTVSFDNDGEPSIGGGMSIYKDVYVDKLAAKHLKVALHGSNVIVAAFDGTIRIMILNDNDKVVETKDFSFTEFPKICDLVELNNRVVLLLGQNTILPLVVEAVPNNINLFFGQRTSFENELDSTPYFDTLDDNKCIVMSTRVDTTIYASYGCVSGDKTNTKITLHSTVKIAEGFLYHGVAGMSSSRAIIGYSGSTTPLEGIDPLHFTLGKIVNNTISKGFNTYNYVYHGAKGSFDFDNIDSEIAIITFVDSESVNGLVCLMLRYDIQTDNVAFGSFFDIQDGGASGRQPDGDYQFVDIRILSDTRFGVFYSNFINGGAMCFIMCEITPARDIIQLGPEYILSKAVPNTKTDYYYSAQVYSTDKRFYLVDSLIASTKSSFNLHIGEVMSNPIGIVTEQTDKYLSIGIAGIWTIPESYEDLIPGRYYYTNTYGLIVPGEYFGTTDINGISTYIDSHNQLLSNNNRIGYAVSARGLYIESKESLN
ncbi:hypothetical protein WA158_004552 [Blastocystis sp. Blastoise]